jgi:hypothetical protein
MSSFSPDPLQFLCLSREPFLRPGLHSLRAPRARAVKAGRSWRPPAGLGLDSPEHGATLTQVGAKALSSSPRSFSPC